MDISFVSTVVPKHPLLANVLGFYLLLTCLCVLAPRDLFAKRITSFSGCVYFLTNLIFGFAYNFHIKFSMFFRRLAYMFFGASLLAR